MSSAAHEPSMDEILRSIRRIIRNDKEEVVSSQRQSMVQAAQAQPQRAAPVRRAVVSEPVPVPKPVPVQKAKVKAPKPKVVIEPVEEKKAPVEDDNLIMMKVHDQKRLRILEKKLQMMEREYEQKLAVHRDHIQELRAENEELAAAAKGYQEKIEMLSENLKSAHQYLEKFQQKNKELRDELDALNRMDPGGEVLQAIQREFVNLYHPERAQGDQLSKLVRHEIYNEFSQVLQGVRNRIGHH